MNKKIAVVLFLVICIIAVFIIFVKNKNTTVQNNVEQRNIATTENGKIEEFEELLKENGLNLKDKEEIFLNEINNQGYAYNLNGERVKMYLVDSQKMEHLMLNIKDNKEVVIATKNSNREMGIYYNEILILNCDKNKSKILKIIN